MSDSSAGRSPASARYDTRGWGSSTTGCTNGATSRSRAAENPALRICSALKPLCAGVTRRLGVACSWRANFDTTTMCRRLGGQRGSWKWPSNGHAGRVSPTAPSRPARRRAVKHCNSHLFPKLMRAAAAVNYNHRINRIVCPADSAHVNGPYVVSAHHYFAALSHVDRFPRRIRNQRTAGNDMETQNRRNTASNHRGHALISLPTSAPA